MPGLRRPNKNKSPPIFSHEFVIQNHADIVSCVAMVFVIGLVFQATNPVASLFVTVQHNLTQNETGPVEDYMYTYGIKDVFTTFFYLLLCVIIHAVIQEYILDKLNRRMHLSKIKHSKFNESGQLLAFYLAAAIWGIDIIVRENYATNISLLWEGYPHATVPFMVKFYFIIQIAYWLHCFPELYFQKTKKDEMMPRIQYATLYLVFITAAYLLNFTRVALSMMVLHYIVESVFHFSRLLYFSEKSAVANKGFMLWNVLFVLIRLGTITLAVLTFWYGLAQSGQRHLDLSTGNFNTQIVRINCLAAVCLLQAWMMWNFITFHLRRMRERNTPPSSSRKLLSGSQKKKDKKTKGKRDDGESEASGPESVGPAENGTVTRQRSVKSKHRH